MCAAGAAESEISWPIDEYNVAWTTQSKSSAESMPCGGGDIGLNVWVEGGDLLFYVQRSGCFDENNEFLKVPERRVPAVLPAVSL
jgi:hypothetical protein